MTKITVLLQKALFEMASTTRPRERSLSATWARADEFLPGVALAMLQQAHPDRWARWSRHGQAWFWGGVAACAAVAWALSAGYYVGDRYGFAMTAFGSRARISTSSSSLSGCTLKSDCGKR